MNVRTEALLSDPGGFALDASPLQRAICRASDGEPIPGDLLDDEAVQAHFGCDRSQTGLRAPVLVVLVAGVRSGKSLLAGCAGVRCALTADLSQLRPHEVPRVVIVGPTVSNAADTFRLLAGHVDGSRVLASLVVARTAESLTLRRPDGRLVEIVVIAAHRGAVTLRGVWLAGVIVEEAAQLGVEVTGAAVTAEELLRAGETRTLPRGQVWIITSPFGPQGLVYDLWKEYFGKPGRYLVVHAPTRAMNPAFSVEQIEEIRRRAPDVAAREYDAAWIDADTAFLDGGQIDAAVMATNEPPIAGAAYVAAWDAATRGNSWTLVVARRDASHATDRVVVANAWQWTGSKAEPLNPERVIAAAAAVLAPYRVSVVRADQWGFDALRPLAERAGLILVEHTTTAAGKVDAFRRIGAMLSASALWLPPHPMVAVDLKGVRRKAVADGVRVTLPRTADGRHCDFAAAIALVVEVAANPSATAAASMLRAGGHCDDPRVEQAMADLRAMGDDETEENAA